MKSTTVAALHGQFEQLVHTESGTEYWLARDLQPLLGYTEWRNLEAVLDKAKTACQAAGQSVSDHFVDVNKMIPLPKGAEREVRQVLPIFTRRERSAVRTSPTPQR